jgi:hypothetical protein
MPAKDKKTEDRDGSGDRKVPKINHSNELHSKFLKRVAVYALFVILTIALTVLVFYRAKGYTFTKNGQVERRGIVLVDSAPVSAKIFLDNKEVDKTDSKLEVPEGQHTIRLEADGYRTWQRNFNMQREKVVWFYYPYLIPKTLSSKPFITNQITKSYSKISPEGKVISSYLSWQGASQTQNLELINLKEGDPAKASFNLTVSNLLFTRQADGNYGQTKFVEWSPNGDSMLVEHTYDGKKEIINLRINNPAESTNLTRQLAADIKEVHYDSRSRLYTLVGSELALYDPKTLTKNQVVTTIATSFQNFDDNKYVYSAQTDTGSEIYVQDGQSKPVRTTTLSTKDVTQFDYKYIVDRRTPYLVVTNSASKELQIFKSPLDLTGVISKTDSNPAKLSPLYLATFGEMRSPKIEDSPSGSSQPGTYIALQLTGKKIFIYDFEEESSFSYDLKLAEDPNKEINIADISWLDPQRLQARSAEGDIYYFDYDGNYANLIGNTTQEFSYFVRSRAATLLVSNTPTGGNQLNQIKFKN